MTPARQLSVIDIVVASATIFLVQRILKYYRSRLNRGSVTPLDGPSSKNRIFGITKELETSEDVGKLYEDWATEYGSVYKVPTSLGTEKIMLLDPKAISHFYLKDTTVYVGIPFAKQFIARFFGKGLLWAEGESHRRQRKALTPAFSNAAIRRLTAIFYDSAYKLKTHWDAKLENHPDGGIIEVQEWMNHVALDTIGIAGFSHDFGSLDGKPSAVAAAFESLGQTPESKIGLLLFLLSFVFPALVNIPTKRNQLLLELRETMRGIADELLDRSRKGDLGGEEKSIIGLLIKAESTEQDGKLHMTPEEVLSQMVRYLHPKITSCELTLQFWAFKERLTPCRLRDYLHLTWALIELTKAPEKQDQLRKELLETKGGQDAEWDELTAADKYPYLDAVVHEILRLHPPLIETSRVASEPDIIPLSQPLLTKHGEVTSIAVAKGDNISAPISCMNRSELVWGERAKEFIPERWLSDANGSAGEDAIPTSAREIQAYRNIMTFIDGPRTCLGKNFALAEFKSVLSVLIKNYRFEFPGGPSTKIELARGLVTRPKIEGSIGPNVPLKVQKVE
ncbi:hypothetical protein AAF712_011895 [Marasmius tenuissimus]|uniref:Cytochrome P450 n=1 Tax=Marasmius tenuissimus TaxID=585030 RepID=A0ABR2ZHZ1_9AGAR